MRFMIGILLLVFSLALVSVNGSSVYNETVGNQTNWFVDVHDGFGVGSGDSLPEQTNGDDELDDNGGSDEEEDGSPNKFIKKLSEEISFKSNYLYLSNTSQNSTNNSNNSSSNGEGEENKEPIDWTPIILWSLVGIFIIGLALGAWYIYQIYYY